MKKYKLTIKGEKNAKAIAEKNLKGANVEIIKAIAEGKFTPSKKTEKPVAFLLQNGTITEVKEAEPKAEIKKEEKNITHEEQGGSTAFVEMSDDDNVLEHLVVEAIRKGNEYDINNITKKELIAEVVELELIEEKQAKKLNKKKLEELIVKFYEA